jgi:hypothetical protein
MLKEILHHLLGSCGETHISLMWVVYFGFSLKIKNIVYMLKEFMR